MPNNILHIVVYPVDRPQLLIARFALYAHARDFVDLYNRHLPIDSDLRVLAFDVNDWRQIYPAKGEA